MARDAGGDVLFCEGNVANESDCQAWAQVALDTWGYIDILVANAGARVSGSILDVTEDDWDTILPFKRRATVQQPFLPSPIVHRPAPNSAPGMVPNIWTE